jgi:hypothetical protein
LQPFMKYLAVVAIALPSASLAETMLHVLPGQTVTADLNSWKKPCTDFVLTRDKGVENYLTCNLGPNQAATANIAPDGTAWWTRFWGAGGFDRPGFVARVRDELGLMGEPDACLDYGDPAECWMVGTMQVMIPMAQLAGQWTVIMQDTTIYQQD